VIRWGMAKLELLGQTTPTGIVAMVDNGGRRSCIKALANASGLGLVRPGSQKA
jgi:hypothetical protein